MNTQLNTEPTYQTLDSLMRQSITDALQADRLLVTCRNAAEKAIDQAISDAFNYSSPFLKMIKQAVAQSLPIVDVDELAVFTDAVRQVVQKRLANMADETARRQMDIVLEKLLPDATVITMKDFHEAYIAKVRDKHSIDNCECVDSDHEPEHTWTIKKSKNVDGYWDLNIADSEDADRYGKNSISLRFNSGGEPDLHKCWYARVGTSDQLAGSIFCGPLYGFDAMLFRLYTGTAKLHAEI